MKTTPEERAHLRKCCTSSVEYAIENANTPAMTALLDDLDEALAELAALRRVDDENMYARRDPAQPDERWCVVSEGRYGGYASTLAEALADYDARKEQTSC